jgi:glycine/D-amino acid oxidase-like deaminating enzyme
MSFMRINYSPWVYQLKKDRVCQKLQKDAEVDVAIIGAGIAGISTAFFILKYTAKKVFLMDRYKIAHGATGHNAGQIVSYFERGFASLVDEFGLDLAKEGQQGIEDAWELLNEMYTDAGLNIPFSRFLGHAGLSSYEQVMLHLKNNFFRKQAGMNLEKIIISDRANFLDAIPNEYRELYSLVSSEEVQNLLETKKGDFVAVLSYQKGCVNSALFCEEIALYLLQKYSERFSIYENTQIDKVILRHKDAYLDAGNHTITAQKVILCTNGFSSIIIINENGLDINTKFHHHLHGTIGYMSGYLEKMNKPPVAISYLMDPDPNTLDPYFYLTRRMYEYEEDKDYNLISIGGPEIALDDHMRYSHEHDYPDEIPGQIDEFVRKIYDIEPNHKIDFIFTWHGLMGYTKNGVRMVGPEPKNSVLMYNLGCNGIGILPSIYGGKKISEFILEKKMGKSIFDIPEEYK